MNGASDQGLDPQKGRLLGLLPEDDSLLLEIGEAITIPKDQRKE